MNHDCQNQPERIHGQMPLPTGNLLAGIVPSLLAAFGGAYRLAVDDGHGRRRFLPGSSPCFLSQGIVKFLPDAVVSPSPEDAVNRAPVGKTGGQHPPLAAGPHDIEDGVDHPTPADASPTTTMHWRQEWSNDLPLSIRQVTGIMPRNFHATAPAFGSSQKTGAVATFLDLRNFKTRSKS